MASAAAAAESSSERVFTAAELEAKFRPMIMVYGFDRRYHVKSRGKSQCPITREQALACREGKDATEKFVYEMFNDAARGILNGTGYQGPGSVIKTKATKMGDSCHLARLCLVAVEILHACHRWQSVVASQA
jgi:hypothetical protein